MTAGVCIRVCVRLCARACAYLGSVDQLPLSIISLFKELQEGIRLSKRILSEKRQHAAVSQCVTQCCVTGLKSEFSENVNVVRRNCCLKKKDRALKYTCIHLNTRVYRCI